MARLPIKTDVLRALFARSGNQCAFPGCTASLINDKNLFIAQVCHIEAAETGGERFNAGQTDEQRRQYENLILLCYPHHVETNDFITYPVERLREMKVGHETTFEKNNFKIDESLLYKISLEMEEYWTRVEYLHSHHHIVSDLAISIDAKATYFDLMTKARGLLVDVIRLRDMVIASDNALYPDLLALIESLGLPPSTLDAHQDKVHHFQERNWEVLNLGFTNTVSILSVALTQMEIKYLEEYLKLNSNDSTAKEKMRALKEEFEMLATSAGYAD